VVKEAAAHLWRYKSRSWAVAGWSRWLAWVLIPAHADQ
jgi:hypothetical protein